MAEHPTPTTLEEAMAAASAIWAPWAVRPREERLAALGSRVDLFAPMALKIGSKGGGPLWPFVLNPIQQDYLRYLRRTYAVTRGEDFFQGWRDLIVKPRQLGFSTFIAAIYFFSGLLRPGRTAVILSHDRDISEILLETYSRFWEHLPPELKRGLSLDTDTKYEFSIRFPGDQALHPPSKFTIDTEAGHPWRGGKIDDLHASEAAFYRNFKGFLASYLMAVPDMGNAVLETTTNGMNDYYGEVKKSLDGNSPFRVVFYEWWRHPEYRRTWDPAQQAPLVPEEMELLSKGSINLDQLAWRRAKIQVLGDVFMQEFPESLLGAFLSTGRPFFNAQLVSAAYQVASALGAPKPSCPRNGVFIWEDPQPWESYLIAADTAEGVDRGETDLSDPERGGSDFSCAYVLHLRSLRAVACIHGRFPPAEFGQVLAVVGRRYRAPIAVERNNHGHTVLLALENANYPELYRHLEYDQAGQKFLKLGFPTKGTGTHTRMMVLDALDEAIRRGALHCPDPGFWREAHTFHRDPNGKPQALPGHHDDRIMSMAIAVYLATLGRGAWGLPMTADGWGIQMEAPQPQQPAPPPLPPPLRGPNPHEAAENPWGNLSEVRAAHRGLVCGACLHCTNEFCAHLRARVRSTDPGCPAHYPADSVLDEGTGDSWGEDASWV